MALSPVRQRGLLLLLATTAVAGFHSPPGAFVRKSLTRIQSPAPASYRLNRHSSVHHLLLGDGFEDAVANAYHQVEETTTTLLADNYDEMANTLAAGLGFVMVAAFALVYLFVMRSGAGTTAVSSLPPPVSPPAPPPAAPPPPAAVEEPVIAASDDGKTDDVAVPDADQPTLDSSSVPIEEPNEVVEAPIASVSDIEESTTNPDESDIPIEEPPEAPEQTEEPVQSFGEPTPLTSATDLVQETAEVAEEAPSPVGSTGSSSDIYLESLGSADVSAVDLSPEVPSFLRDEPADVEETKTSEIESDDLVVTTAITAEPTSSDVFAESTAATSKDDTVLEEEVEVAAFDSTVINPSVEEEAPSPTPAFLAAATSPATSFVKPKKDTELEQTREQLQNAASQRTAERLAQAKLDTDATATLAKKRDSKATNEETSTPVVPEQTAHSQEEATDAEITPKQEQEEDTGAAAEDVAPVADEVESNENEKRGPVSRFLKKRRSIILIAAILVLGRRLVILVRGAMMP